MTNQEVDIREGTITFWIPEKKMKFDDRKFTPLVQLNPHNGGIFINKNEDNKLEFTHMYIGKGTTMIEHDVSSLESDKSHMIAVTWSLKNREIIMYIDGEEVKREGIRYKN